MAKVLMRYAFGTPRWVQNATVRHLKLTPF
jgi:hypothetical protein